MERVRISDIAAELFVDNGNGGTRNRSIVKVRVARVHGGIPCKYYVRLFKKIDLNFDTQITRAAFSLNAYSDRIAQIALNGDIEIGDLSDNLGRPLSELYLTLIKNNKGHELWYDRNVFNDENIEFSHCFGPVSAGIDLPTDEFCEKYNIHRIHNIANADADSRGGGIPHSPAHLKTGITIDDDEFLDCFTAGERYAVKFQKGYWNQFITGSIQRRGKLRTAITVHSI